MAIVPNRHPNDFQMTSRTTKLVVQTFVVKHSYFGTKLVVKRNGRSRLIAAGHHLGMPGVPHGPNLFHDPFEHFQLNVFN